MIYLKRLLVIAYRLGQIVLLVALFIPLAFASVLIQSWGEYLLTGKLGEPWVFRFLRYVLRG